MVGLKKNSVSEESAVNNELRLFAKQLSRDYLNVLHKRTNPTFGSGRVGSGRVRVGYVVHLYHG